MDRRWWVLLLLLPMPASGELALAGPLIPPGAADEARVGEALALDLPWLAVVAPGHDKIHFYYQDGGWQLKQTVVVPMGRTVDVAMEDGHAAIGDPENNRVHLLEYDTVWQRTDTLTGTERFGSAVAMSDHRLAVGAPGPERFGPLEAEGTVTIYEHQGTWQRDTVLKRGGTGAETRFGAALDMHDGRLLVGAPAREIEDQVFEGSIYIFERTSAWQETFHWVAGHRAADEASFGGIVALHGDWAIAGNPSDLLDNVIIYGDLFFFAHQGSWRQVQEMSTDARTLDFDGQRLIGGSWHRDWTWIMERTNSRWSVTQYIDAPTQTSYDFGASVAIERGHVIVGSPDYRTGNRDTGAAWAFVDNLPPVAVAKHTGNVQLAEHQATTRITLDGRDSYDPDGTIASYRWHGDGLLSDASTVSVDLAAGTHKFTLTVHDNLGFYGHTSLWVKVLEAPKLKPSFTFTPNDRLPQTPIRFTDTSVDESGTIVAWDWDFDEDGVVDSTAKNPTHLFAHSGRFEVCLTITDDDGNTAHASRIVTVLDDLPTADAGDDVVATEYDEAGKGVVTLNGSKSSDPEGPVTYEWSIGGIPIGDQESVTWSFDEGVTPVRLAVRDSAGQTALDTVEVLVRRGGQNGTFGYNDPPDVAGSWRMHPQAIPLTAVFLDASTDARTKVAFIGWDFDGDGDWDSEADEAIHRFGRSGTYEVAHRAVDMDGAESVRTFDVRMHNEPPVAAFQPLKTTINPGEVVVFRDLSHDLEAPIAAWRWDFGVERSHRQDVGITFTEPGTHIVTLQVTDAEGFTSHVTGEVIVRAPPPPPAEATVGQDTKQALAERADRIEEGRKSPDVDAQGNILPGREGSPFKLTEDAIEDNKSWWWLWLVLAVAVAALVAWRYRASPSPRV